MSYSVSGTTITLTRGDTFKAVISITNPDGTSYVPVTGDTIRFAAKKDYKDDVPIMLIDIPIDTMVLEIKPDDTRNLSFGTYVYDIQLTKANGDVDTFITTSKIKITEEVY